MNRKQHNGKQFWLMKCEPSAYSIDDLARDKQTEWEGVRNYQARNFMRDMRDGDGVLFYASNVPEPGIVGEAVVCKEAYPDFTQFDATSRYFDGKSTKDKPRWDMVDVCFKKKFAHPITLADIKADPALSTMMVTQKGSRLSIQPVAEAHFAYILKLAK